METASAAATDAFFKLILNSLLSCSVLALPQCYWVDNPKIGNGFDLIAGCCPIALPATNDGLSAGAPDLGAIAGDCGRPAGKGPMRRLLPIALVCAALWAAATPAAPPPAAPAEESLAAMRALDQRVATIGHRLAVAGLGWCAERAWLPGLAVHDLSQYGADFRAAAIRAFGLDAGPAVLALAAGGPAERAGLRADDILLAFDGRPPPRGALGRGGSFELMERILAALDEAFADGRATIEVRRGGARRAIAVAAEQGCATRFQLIPGRSLNARADGRYVQLSTAIAQYVADDGELAAVLAHEFAHNVLGHRVRLDDARVRRGFLGNFGRNARRIRETEIEADRLSVYLMERAGYDPQAAVRFWSRFGRRGLNFLGSPTHPNWRSRVQLIETEIAAIRRARAAGQEPVPAFATLPR
jgi:Zn-dependent protease with chaperone function